MSTRKKGNASTQKEAENIAKRKAKLRWLNEMSKEEPLDKEILNTFLTQSN